MSPMALQLSRTLYTQSAVLAERLAKRRTLTRPSRQVQGGRPLFHLTNATPG